ncbi:serine hydrolase domain-containing protein [uncultured Leifsonia sp.]|uniref:serine hydrolase domain-containing protein n=1 Tax=uncultured Leifsonia sp. TaxID=340359 RepID=UPI0028D08595|nr:serine hydrolase domain-containing protein [uncultured Leifsonia sp.]
MSDADLLLSRFVSSVDREGLGVYGAVALVGDDESAHRWRSDDRENLYSVSKGVSALAAGIAVDAGILALDTTVGEALPGLELGDGVDRVTLRDLLTMSSGIDFVWFGDEPVPGADLAQEMLRRPTRGPGEGFRYSDASTYVAMRMLEARVGDVRDWLLPRLFDPLEIDNPQWLRCPLGHILGGTGLQLRTGELARIGRLLRDRGEGRGRRLVSAGWVDGMHSGWRETGLPATSDRYGLAVWAGPSGLWRLDGRYGQYVIVDDAHGAVLTITAHEEFRDDRLLELAHQALLS